MAETAEDLIRRKDKLKRELVGFQQKAAVAEADERRIKAELEGLLEVLSSKYGCSSFPEAETDLARMRDTLTTELDELEAILDALRSA